MKVQLLFFTLLLSASLHSTIVEINEIDEIRPYLQEGAVYLFDVDDTLIDNPFSLGSSVWRQWIKPYKLESKLYDALTYFIAQKAPYKAVEPAIPPLIAELQNKGEVVFAFTARGRAQWYSTDIAGIDQFTHAQLRHVGIDFNKTTAPSELQTLDPEFFFEGIIFAHHIKKGDLLKSLLKDFRPSSVIFVDDKREQVESVDAALSEMGIPTLSFWYRRAELNRKNFNPMVSNIQLEALLNGHFLSDEEAEIIVGSMEEKFYLSHFSIISHFLKAMNISFQ